MELVLPHQWRPRSYQKPLWRYLEGGGKRAIAVWHRRSGKDAVALHHIAVAAHMRVANYWHLLPEQAQARKAIWTAVDAHTGKRRIDEAFPLALRETTLENEMMIRFRNGSVYQLAGSDNYDSLVGSAPAGVVFSEWALANPSAWAFIRPMLLENQGWALFVYTPRGRNHGSTFFDAHKRDPDWFVELLSAQDTSVFTAEQLASERADMIKEYGPEDGQNRYAQEYLCSFDAGVIGGYFGPQFEKIDAEHRICPVPLDPGYPVHTAWDLGIGDDTAIWLVQVVGMQMRVVGYIQNSGVGLEWYAKELDKWDCRWGEHILPHDAAAKELGTGRTREETLCSLGLRRTRILPPSSVADGINAGRLLLARAWFDEAPTERGVNCLRNYRREWDDRRKAFHDRPLHDWASHACLTADALVLTDAGLRPIAEVLAGDSVWTPCGHSRVSHAGPVKQIAELVEIDLADGRQIRCSREHKVLTNRGFIEASALRYSDGVFRGDEWTIRLISWCLRATNTGFRAAIMCGQGRAERRSVGQRSISTGQCGKATTGLYRKAVRSITRMAILLTTPSITFSASSGAPIEACTLVRTMRPSRFRRQAPWRFSGLLNGTRARRGWNGTKRMAAALGSTGFGTSASASSAASRFFRLILRLPSGATRIAKLKTCASAEGATWVYDLTVVNHACYQANGILVSNSDAWRYLALANLRSDDEAMTRPIVYDDRGIV